MTRRKAVIIVHYPRTGENKHVKYREAQGLIIFQRKHQVVRGVMEG